MEMSRVFQQAGMSCPHIGSFQAHAISRIKESCLWRNEYIIFRKPTLCSPG